MTHSICVSRLSVSRTTYIVKDTLRCSGGVMAVYSLCTTATLSIYIEVEPSASVRMRTAVVRIIYSTQHHNVVRPTTHLPWQAQITSIELVGYDRYCTSGHSYLHFAGGCQGYPPPRRVSPAGRAAPGLTAAEYGCWIHPAHFKVNESYQGGTASRRRPWRLLKRNGDMRDCYIHCMRCHSVQKGAA